MPRRRAPREIQVQLARLLLEPAARGVKRHLRQPRHLGQLIVPPEVVERGVVDRLALGLRNRLVDGVAQQRVPEADAPAPVPREDAALDQPPHADAGVELRVDPAAAAFQLLQHAFDLLAAELDAQHRSQPRVRQQIGRQRLRLPARQPLHQRKVGQPLQLVGGEVPALSLLGLAHQAVALEAAHQLDEQHRDARACARPGGRARSGGTFSAGESSRRASSIGRRRVERRQRDLLVFRRAAGPGGAAAAERRPPDDAHPDRTARLHQRGVFDGVQRGLVDEVRVLDDQRQRLGARRSAQRLAERARRRRTQRARRRRQRTKLRVFRRRPRHRHRDARPHLRARLRAQLLRQQRAAEIRGRLVGQRQRALQQLARRLLAHAAQHLLGADEDRLHARRHLEVLHQHLRQVALAVTGLAHQRRDRRPRAADRAARQIDERAQQLVAPDQRRDAHPRRRPLRRLRRLLQAHEPGPAGDLLAGRVGQHLDGRRRQQHAGRIGLARILLLLAEQRALVAARPVGARLHRNRRQIDQHRLRQAAGDEHLAGGGGGARRVVADLVSERQHVLRARRVRELRADAVACLANRRDVALALEEQQRDHAPLARGRGRFAAGLAASPAAAPAPAAAGCAAVPSRRARSATRPACSARRSSVALAKRRSGSLARQRMIASSSATATGMRRDSGGGRRLRWFCWTSAELPQNGGAPASIS